MLYTYVIYNLYKCTNTNGVYFWQLQEKNVKINDAHDKKKA